MGKLAIFTGVPETWPAGLYEVMLRSLTVDDAQIINESTDSSALSQIILERLSSSSDVEQASSAVEEYRRQGWALVDEALASGSQALCDPAALATGDFWLAAHEDVCLVVAYLTSSEFFESTLSRLSAVSESSVAESLDVWLSWARKLVELRGRWGDRVVLVPYPSVMMHTKKLLDYLSCREFIIHRELDFSKSEVEAAAEPNSQFRWVLDAWLSGCPDVAGIDAELRRCAIFSNSAESNLSGADASMLVAQLAALTSVPLSIAREAEWKAIDARRQRELAAEESRIQVLGNELRGLRIDLISKIDSLRTLQLKEEELEASTAELRQENGGLSRALSEMGERFTASERKRLLVERQLKRATEGLESASLEVEAAVRKTEFLRIELTQSSDRIGELEEALDAANSESAAANARIRTLEFENTELQSNRSERWGEYEAELLRYSEKVSALERSREVAEQYCRDADAVAQRTRENHDLMELQLLQAQEELREAFLASAAPKYDRNRNARDFLLKFWEDHFPQDLWVDLRREINGENWYSAELDGRWTGPGNLATITMPPFPSGKFDVELEVYGMVSPRQVEGVNIVVGASRFPAVLEAGSDSLPCVLTAECQCYDFPINEPWALAIEVPEVLFPVDEDSADRRLLGVRIRYLRVIQRYD